jgi:hypothetical protein
MINLNDNISIVFTNSAVDLVSGQTMSIPGNGSQALIFVDSDIGPSIVLKSNQNLLIRRADVTAKITQKSSMSFWVKLAQITPDKSVPIVGIGTQTLVSGFAIPSSASFYVYANADSEGVIRVYISFHGNDNSINVFSYGPVEPFITNHYIITYDLSQGIISLYVNGAVADLVYEPNASVPSALPNQPDYDLVINRFSGSSISNMQSGGFEISDLMIYTDFISNISDVASIINDGSYNFLRRKSGNVHGEFPEIIPPGIASAFQKGRINDSASTSFGVLAGLEDGSLILGTEKAWQRRIFFGNLEESSNIKFSKTSNDYDIKNNPDGSLSVRGANFKVL